MQFTSMTMGAPAVSTTRVAGQSYAVPAASVVGGTVAQSSFAPNTYSATGGLPTTYVSGPVSAAPSFATIGAQPSIVVGQPQMFSSVSAAPRVATIGAQPSVVVGQPQMVSSGAISTFATQGSMPYGSMTMGAVVGQPTTMFSSAQPPTIRTTGPVAATYVGGVAVTQASANLLAAGRVVSERVMTLEEAYGSGIVRAQGGAVVAPQLEVIESVQVVPEVVVDQAGLLEVVQVPEIVETVVVEQPVMIEQQELVGEGEMVAQVEQPGPPRVVIICTSASAPLVGDAPTGAWSEEITAPYYVFLEAGCEVYIASVAGGQVPIDQGSLGENFIRDSDRRFQEEGGLELLAQSIALADVSPEAIDCVWLAGGHGTVMDFEASLAQFVTDAAAMGRPVGAVCHGVFGLFSAINQDGSPLLQGKQATGFSNAEEDAVGLSGVVPYLCEDRMKDCGAIYSCDAPWSEYAIRDGNLITGQNPQSSFRAAQLCIEAMMPPQ